MHKNAEGIEGSETSKKIANLPNPVTAERIKNRGSTETGAEIAQRFNAGKKCAGNKPSPFRDDRMRQSSIDASSASPCLRSIVINSSRHDRVRRIYSRNSDAECAITFLPCE